MSGRRFIVLSDLHLHAWTYGSSIVNGRNSRLLDQANLLSSVLIYTLEHDIKNLVFTGDFFHTHSSIRSEVLSTAHFFLSNLKKQGIKSIFLIGNHDYSDKEGDLHALDFLKEFGDVVELSGRYDDLFWAMSYTEDENKLRTFLDNTPDKSIVLLHQGISRMPVNSKGFTINEILDPAMIPDRAAGAFVGHYHSRFKVEGRNIWSPGSPMQLTWTDAGETRGILDVVYKDGEVEVKEVELDSPKFVELTSTDPEYIAQNSEGNFIKVNNLEIKEQVLKHGARSCELVSRQTDERRLEIPDSGSFDSLPSLVGAYMDHKQLEASVRKVGEQIIEGTYAAIKVNRK